MDKVILKSKPKLINWLKLDPILILQYVQADDLITTSEYGELNSMTVPRDMVIKLLDIILGKGENVSRIFLTLLKRDEVNEFSPELRKWIENVDTSETANTAGQSGIQVTSKISASGGSNVFSPTITGANLGATEMNMGFPPPGKSNMPANYQKPDKNSNESIQDYQKFLKANTSHLVQNVKNIDAIIDVLDLHNELVANVRAQPTRQRKMRELLDCVNCESFAVELVNALFKYEASLMKEMQY